MRYLTRRNVTVAAALLIAAVIGTYAVAQGPRYPAAPTRIQIAAVPITSFDNADPTRVRFGALEFRGGLSLTSALTAFGGISGLVMPDHDHIVAITDNGSWLKARLVYRDGRLDAVTDGEMAPMLGDNGKPLAAQGVYDTEALTRIGDNYYVGVERVHRIVRFGVNQAVAARASDVAVPTEFRSLAGNASLECLMSPPLGQPHAGKLIAITERSLDEAGHHRSFVIDPSARDGNTNVLRFSVRRRDEFSVTDCTYFGDGALLILERRFSPARGVAMRIRRIPLSAIKESALADGPSLIEADLGYQIDNMEGIAVTQNAAGETIITLVSDDNFSPIQRNLILQFAVVD